MQFSLLVFTGLIFPFLFKFLDIHIGMRTRLIDRVKATQLYYELKSKGANALEISRAAQAMVGSKKAKEALILHFIQIHEIDNDFSELDMDVDRADLAWKYLKFDSKRSFQEKLYFIDSLSKPSNILKFNILKFIYYILCISMACLPPIYYVFNFLKGHVWADFYFGYQTLTIGCFLSIIWAGIWMVFAIRQINDGYNLNDANKMMRRLNAKINTTIDVVESKETESKLEVEDCENEQYSQQL